MWLAWSWYGYSAVTCLQKRYYLSSSQSENQRKTWQRKHRGQRNRVNFKPCRSFRLLGAVSNDEMQTMTICPKHRLDLTTNWPGRKVEICCYPDHEGTKRGLKLPRRVNADMSAEIFVLFNAVVPIGSGQCNAFIFTDFLFQLKVVPTICIKRVEHERP